MRSLLSFDPVKRSLELQPLERSYLGFLTHAAQVKKFFIFIYFLILLMFRHF